MTRVIAGRIGRTLGRRSVWKAHLMTRMPATLALHVTSSSAPRSHFVDTHTLLTSLPYTAPAAPVDESAPFSSSSGGCVYKTPGGTSWSRWPGGDPGGGVVRVTRGASDRPGPAWAGRGWVRCGSVVSQMMGHMGRRSFAMVGWDGAAAEEPRWRCHTVAGASGAETPGVDSPALTRARLRRDSASTSLDLNMIPCPALALAPSPRPSPAFASPPLSHLARPSPTAPSTSSLAAHGIIALRASRREGAKEGQPGPTMRARGGAAVGMLCRTLRGRST